MATIRSMSGLPARIPAVSSNTSTSMTASRKARRKLAIRDVANSTSPSRRRATTRMRGRGGRSKGSMVFDSGVVKLTEELGEPVMHASKMTTEGSNATALFEVLGIVGQRLHCRALRVDFRLEPEHVLELRPAMLADIAERQVTNVHAMYHKRTRDAEDARRIVGAQFLVFGQDRDPITLKQVAEKRLDQRGGVRRQGQGLIGAAAALHPHFDPVALGKLPKAADLLTIGIGQLGKLEHMGGHEGLAFAPQYSD